MVPNRIFVLLLLLQPDMVPKINKVEIFDNVLTASVNMTNVDEFDLCMKVETTTGEPKDYKPLQGKGHLVWMEMEGGGGD